MMIYEAINWLRSRPLSAELTPAGNEFAICALRSILRADGRRTISRATVGKKVRDSWVFSELGKRNFCNLSCKELKLRVGFRRSIGEKSAKAITMYLDSIIEDLDKDATINYGEWTRNILVDRLNVIEELKRVIDFPEEVIA